MIKNQNQGYISLHVTEINDLHSMSFHVARHFMLYFTSFHVAFHIILCHISYISLHTFHALNACHACRAFRISRTVRISCITAYVASFYVSFYIILSWKFILHSFIPFRSEESRNRVKTAHSSIECHFSRTFYSRG